MKTMTMSSNWSVTVLTLFPEMFPGPLDVSLLGKARETNLWSLEVHDIRDHGLGKHRNVGRQPGRGWPRHGDARRCGGRRDRCGGAQSRPLIYLSPRGAPLTQARVRDLAAGPGAILLCGRFEGLDQRVLEARQIEEISLGDFVLAGGEIAAMALIEAAVRLIPGVLGDHASIDEESFAAGLLEYPHYTRPQAFEGLPIPQVLNQGNHSEIAKFRLRQAQDLTKARRPDLWALYEKTPKP